MLHEGGLHLEGSYAVAAGLDDVVLSAHEPIKPVFVAPGEVAGVVVFAAARRPGAFGIVLVACHQTVLMGTEPYRDLAVRAVGHGILLVVDEVDVIEGAGLA